MTSPGRQFETDGAPLHATVTGIVASADFEPGQFVAGRYRIERLLGMGGMGVVYQARDIELDVDVALKLLRPEFASRPDAFERFRQELLLARQVSSAHVVRIHDLVRHGAVWLISMDYVDGRSLERMLDHEGALAPDVAVRIVRQVALGLAAAHHRHVVHRDLKPANVLMNKAGDAAITDFGVARSAGSTGITGSGVIIGTPEYLSPEQARADPVDGRSDLYALGLILFEMLTGTLPFRGGTPAEMLAQRVVRDPPSVATMRSGLPAFVVRLCDRLLELKPARRFQTAEDVVRAIDARRVPGFGAVNRRRIATAAIAIALSAAVALAWRAWPSPSATSTNAASTPLELAVLPFVVQGAAPNDGDIAVGVQRRLADALAARTGRHDADFERVQRALAELGYDAGAAGRHLPRVAEALGARRLLVASWRRGDDGIEVGLEIRDPAADAPTWSRRVHAIDDAALPMRLRELESALDAQLGIATGGDAWPPASTLAAIGRLQRTLPTAATFDDELRAASEAGDATLWWTLLSRLDREGRVADANAVARRIVDTVGGEAVVDRRLRAYADVVLGEHERAGTSLERLHADAPDDAAATLLLARVRAEQGAYEGAQKLLLPLVADDARDIDAWFALGKYTIQGGDAKRAVDDYLVRAQVLANRLDDRRMRADVANAMGIGYRRLGQLMLAAEQLGHAEQLRSDLGDRRGQAATLRNLATVRSVQGDFAAAGAALDKAKAIIQPLGDAGAMADLANDEGLLDEEQGDYRAALDAYRHALNLRQSGGDAQLVGESQVNVGFIYYQIGEFDNAQTYSEQAIATYAKVGDRAGAVRAQQNLGLIQVARGDWKAARRTQDAAIRTSEELQMAEESTIGHAALAELDHLEGDAVSALAHVDAALADFDKRGDVRGTTEMKLVRSAIHSDLGDPKLAAAALEGLDPAQVANGEQASLLASRLGEIAIATGDREGALAHARDALERAQHAHALAAELSARLLDARALAAQGRDADARRRLADARTGAAHYASVPLRLRLAEAELEIGDGDAMATWRETRALLARLPAYVRMPAIAAFAARRLPEPAADDARRAARGAYDRVAAKVPGDGRDALARLAVALGIDTEAKP